MFCLRGNKSKFVWLWPRYVAISEISRPPRWLQRKENSWKIYSERHLSNQSQSCAAICSLAWHMGSWWRMPDSNGIIHCWSAWRCTRGRTSLCLWRCFQAEHHGAHCISDEQQAELLCADICGWIQPYGKAEIIYDTYNDGWDLCRELHPAGHR